MDPSSLPEPFRTVVTLILIAWAAVWFLVPFLIWRATSHLYHIRAHLAAQARRPRAH